MSTAIDQQVATFQEQFNRVKDEVSKVIVGSDEIIDGVIMSLLASGHVLLEGVPGLGKTKLVSTLSDVMRLKFSRIQFTPDLMPADVTGVALYRDPTRGFEFQPGPVFTDFLLADEINRAPAKTQAALLEAMAERQVTADGTSRPPSSTRSWPRATASLHCERISPADVAGGTPGRLALVEVIASPWARMRRAMPP